MVVVVVPRVFRVVRSFRRPVAAAAAAADGRPHGREMKESTRRAVTAGRPGLDAVADTPAGASPRHTRHDCAPAASAPRRLTAFTSPAAAALLTPDYVAVAQ